MESKEVLDILYKQNYLSEEDYIRAKDTSSVLGRDPVDLLRSEGLVTADLIGQGIAEHYKLPYADLNSIVPNEELLQLIQPGDAITYRIVPFQKTTRALVVATDHPTSELKKKLSALFGKKSVKLAYSLTEDIDRQLLYYRTSLQKRVDAVIASDLGAPEIVDLIFEDAIVRRVSDIHFEPLQQTVLVRFRVDGLLSVVLRLPIDVYQSVLNRIKVLARARTDVHRQPQDGSIRTEVNGRRVEMRLSIVPIYDGEKVVLRVLSNYIKTLSLGDLGLSQQQAGLLRKVAKNPFGMILVVGPTGSGKTTSLYGLIKEMNSPTVNIATIEDPVEYKIDGVNHIQVDEKVGLTFERGLRSIVRQDPDMILVGEIRDRISAEISVNAALTGHMLFSTFHANDAQTAIPRLIDMGVEPFLLSSTLELVIAQRLVRRLCESCKISTKLKKADVEARCPGASSHFSGSNYTVYEAKGCPVCHGTGYRGRIAVFQMLEVSPAIEALIMARKNSAEIWKQAVKDGAESMMEDGISKVKQGIVSLEEVNRVTNA